MKILFVTLVVVILVLAGVYFWVLKPSGEPIVSESPAPSDTAIPSTTPTLTPSKTPVSSKVPLPTGDGRTTFIDEKVPWNLLLADASCELKGEIKFLNEKTYDNQDALFTYKGVDHPGRNVKWTVSPAEPNLEIGPNIFSKMPIPNGESLLGIFPKGTLGSKKYELTAVMEYGRLVDEKGKFVTVGGNVKLFQKTCKGKTTVVLP